MPIYVKGNAVEHIYNVPQHQSISYTLCDTGISRFTNSLVSHFNLLCCENNYQKLLQDTYLPLVSSCIQSYLKQDTQALVTSLKNVSAFQFTHFAFAIPASVKNAWAESLAGGDKIYKLCGAGGGGYVLIFSVHDEFEVNG
jgi:mevalonate kinase